MKMFRKMKGKLGFTLAEMLIVVALLAIIMAIAAPNVAKYSKSIKQRELDDSARSIYMAFEHQFASDVEMGVDLTNRFVLGDPKLDSWGGIDKGIVKKPSKTRYTEAFDPDSPDSTMGFIIIRNGTVPGSSEYKNIIESELNHNNYIIEFNPETGDVFGVFYSEKTAFEVGEYEYNSANYDKVDGPFDYAVKSNTSGKYLIGYYGGDGNDDDRINDNTLPKPIVKIINKEKLVATIENGNKDVNITITYGDHEILGDGNPDTDDNTKKFAKNGKVTFILDTLASDKIGNRPGIANEISGEYETDIATWLGKKPSCEDMTLTVTFSDPEGKMKDQTVEKTFNPLFADGTTVETLDDGTTGYTAYIEYGRHLQNLDKAAAAPQKAIIRKTIDFLNDAGNYEGWKNVYGDKKFTPLTIKKIDISAPGVEIKNINIYTEDPNSRGGLFVRSTAGFKAHDIIFRHPIIEGTTIVDAGAVAGVLEGGGEAKNITVINPKFDVKTDAGGIAGYARKCKIINCQVYVEKTDGTDGIDWSDPTNDPYSTYTISSTSHTGGIVGGTEGGATIENCIAAVKVKSGNIAGGLVGKAANNTTIKDCAVFGHTYEGAFDGEFVDPTEPPTDPPTEKQFDLHDNVYGSKAAGGLIGWIDASSVKLEGTVFSTCSVKGTDKVDTAYTNIKPTITAGATVYTLGTAYKIKADGKEEKTTKSADTNIKSAADDEIAIPEGEAVPVAQRYDTKVSAKFMFKVPDSVKNKEMILRGDWPTEEESVSGFFYWEKEGTEYHVKALYYNGLDPNNENSEDPEKEVKDLINNLCYEKDGNSISEYGYGAFKLDSEPDIKYQKATYTSNSGYNTLGRDYAGSYGKIEYSDIELNKILGDKITDSDVPDDIKKAINDELKKKFKDLEINESIIDNIKYVIYKEKDINSAWIEKGTVKATLDEHNYYFAPDYCALAKSESVPFPTDSDRALALGTCSYAASGGDERYIPNFKYLEYWNPYEVRTGSQLRHIQQGCDNGQEAPYAAQRTVQTIENDINVAFKQSHDIKPATALNPIGVPNAWTSLSANAQSFQGTYDGQSYRIIDAQFTEDNNVAGLFAQANFAILQNIILYHEAQSATDFIDLVETPSTTANFIGGIAAKVRNTMVENCVVSGYNITAKINDKLNPYASVNGGHVNSSIGGIVGNIDRIDKDHNPFGGFTNYVADTVSFRYCHANVSFEGANVENLGGILGTSQPCQNLYFENCYSIVHKKDEGIDPETYRIGGIVGEVYTTVFKRLKGCYSIFEGMPEKPKKDTSFNDNKNTVHRCGISQVDYSTGEHVIEQNYYVNDEGFANSNDESEGDGITYKDLLLTKLKPEKNNPNYPSYPTANPADKTYMKAVEPIEKDQPGAYPLMAVTVDVTDGQDVSDIPYPSYYRHNFSAGVTDPKLGKFVHYGPWPEATGGVGDLVRGHLAGIFDVKM